MPPPPMLLFSSNSQRQRRKENSPALESRCFCVVSISSALKRRNHESLIRSPLSSKQNIRASTESCQPHQRVEPLRGHTCAFPQLLFLLPTFKSAV